MEAVHDKLICEVDTAVAVRFVGTEGGVVSAGVLPATRNATICMIQALPLWVAVALYEPVAVTLLSMVMLP
ncbi:MAG: hypothetical protein ACLQHW_09835 [bacterium]